MTRQTDPAAPATAYAAARDRLEALERELAGMDGRLRQAAEHDDADALARLLTRQGALPYLLARARRELAPLRLAACEAELADAEAVTEPAYQQMQAAWVAFEEAQRALNAATANWHAARFRVQDARQGLRLAQRAADENTADQRHAAA
jgi:hypothetical protein